MSACGPSSGSVEVKNTVPGVDRFTMTGTRDRLAAGERGFSLIELLVVILIIAILAAIAIPALLGQKGKAVDASAKELARTGGHAAETYSTDHEGKYAEMTLAGLREYESVLTLCAGKTAAELNNACMTEAKVLEEGKGYQVVAEAVSGDTFTWKRMTGEVTRTCEVAAGGNNGGCPTGKW
jgi:type IV pilus assembly protein PilA